MRLLAYSQISILVILILPAYTFSEGFQTFSKEVSFLKLMLDCPKDDVMQQMDRIGTLYICTLGEAKTVKLYVSENSNSDEVMNIGLLWNDWKINAGYGIHSDMIEVEKALNFLIDMYVPNSKNEIEKAFWDSKNEDFSTDEFRIYYTHKSGLQKDERLLVIEEK